MKCKQCRYWRPVNISDEDIIFNQKMWAWKGKKIGDANACQCTICGFEVPVEKGLEYRVIQEHIIEEHNDVIARHRNNRIGKCANQIFKYKNPEHIMDINELKGKVFYMDSEFYAAEYWIDQDFGCIYFKKEEN